MHLKYIITIFLEKYRESMLFFYHQKVVSYSHKRLNFETKKILTLDTQYDEIPCVGGKYRLWGRRLR